jgi:hypothetical protein
MMVMMYKTKWNSNLCMSWSVASWDDYSSYHYGAKRTKKVFHSTLSAFRSVSIGFVEGITDRLKQKKSLSSFSRDFHHGW